MHAAPRPSTCRPSNAAGRRFRLTRISRGRARRCHKSRPPREFSPYLSPLFPDARGSGKSARCGACWLDHVARPRARPRRKTRTLSNLQRNNSSFSELGVAEPLCRALAARDYHTPTPIQAHAIPLLLAGPRRPRHRPDRHRQDRGLRAADAAACWRDARGRDRVRPRARARADPRARRPDRRRLRGLRRRYLQLRLRRDLRRRQPGAAGRGPAARRRHPGRHARPAARPHGTARMSRSDASSTWCSTRPTACSTWASSATSARSSRPLPQGAADAAVLRHHAGGGRQRSHGRSCTSPARVEVDAPGRRRRARSARASISSSSQAKRGLLRDLLPTGASRA